MKNIWLPGAVLLIALLAAGCGVKPPPLTRESATPDSTRVIQNESFNPLNLNDEDVLKLPESRLKSSGGAGAGGKGTQKSTAGKGTREASGFRVQLIATETESEAREQEQRALLDFQEGVYLIFDPPNYKVRIGNCQTRAQANELKEKAIRMGYPNAWVIQSRVTLTDR